MLDQHFDSKEAEPRLYAAWDASGAFKPNPDPKAEPFCILIPPPNVTGSLHIGHALNNTLQDVLIRFERMRGKAALWQVGLDHAGIATQMVVERQLAEQGNVGRREMGREAFVQRVWDWKAQSGGRILEQLKRLGASADWSRERFTLDEGLSEAVTKVFVQLHGEGLIYRDKRLVNWDPHFQTALSDLEVENREVQGHMWHFKYPLENGETYEFPIAYGEDGEPTEWETRDYIAIATTRPETMLGDGAVAVHPSDKRYAPIVGKRVLLPLADRYIPIITDEYPDPDFGSGAVKITGAHDFNDYQVARRHNLPMYQLMDEQARMKASDIMPAKYVGMDRYVARKAVVEDIEAIGLLDRIETKTIQQPFGDRSNVVVEPYLTDQWFMDMRAMADRALQAVREGETQIVPKVWEKTYFQWLENIEPWCVSRQLWWGHRIPAWFGPDGDIYVAETEAEAQKQAWARHGKDVVLTRDEDVLDTWFSSGLWAFSTLGWPEDTPELKRFYPTSVLVTGFDILFFWVARMMMLSLKTQGQIPFKTVYLHALVRDEKGQKMSKSKGNVLDPLDLVEEFGADALRFTLAAMAAQGRDIKMSKQRVEGYRNFGTKLWNAARFCQMNECTLWEAFDPGSAKATLNRWIIGQTAKAAAEITAELEAFRFDQAAAAVYRFVWNVFCDWYLELAKPLLSGVDETVKDETRRTAAWALDHILRLLHPFMPFVTEELWGKLSEFGPKRERMLIQERWPTLPERLIDPVATAEIDWVIGLISEVRSARAELNVPPAAKAPLFLVGADKASQARLERYQDLIDRLARLEYSTIAAEAPQGAIVFAFEGATVAMPLDGLVDLAVERGRLAKEIARCEAEAARIEGKLANAQFVAKAPPEVIEEQRTRLAGYQAEKVKYEAAVARLPH
jgi:valyl-tRNA synthetase